jgi:tetratricopeptide (TPR) repeat protein
MVHQHRTVSGVSRKSLSDLARIRSLARLLRKTQFHRQGSPRKGPSNSTIRWLRHTLHPEGYLGPYDFDFDRSITEFERAIQLNPNYAMAHHWLSWGPLTALGQFDRAIAEGKRAVELDPLSLINNADLGGNVYFNSRRYDEAIAQLRKTLEIDPRFYIAHYYLGQAFQLKGQLAEAIAEYQKAVELNDDPEALAYLGQAYARAGQRDEAQKILARLTGEAKSRYVSGYSMALMFIGLGDKEQAIDALERAYREGAGNDLFTIKVDPMLDDLRGQARFEALAQKIFRPRGDAKQ